MSDILQVVSAKPEHVAPIPSNATKAAVWSFAEHQRRAAQISSGFDLAQLVNNNGGRISYIGIMDTDQTDAIVVETDGSFTIRLSSNTGVLRDNFTIAHELGHYWLHWPIVSSRHPGKGMHATRRVDRTNGDLMRCEWEANWFASAFLMPKQEFIGAYRMGVASETFGVTDAAVRVRAETLGILTSA